MTSKRVESDHNSNTVTSPPKRQRGSTEIASSFPINELPIEILEVIFAGLPSGKDLVSLSLTSRSLKDRLWDSHKFWHSVGESLGLAKEDWGLEDLCENCSLKPMFDAYLDLVMALRQDKM